MSNEESYVKIQFQSPDQLYVVTKQFAGKKYFARRVRSRFSKYKCDATNTSFAHLFADKAEAERFRDEINANKQKVKLKVEKASRYFCNKIVYDSPYYYGEEMLIKNVLVPIDKVQSQLPKAKSTALANKKQMMERWQNKISDADNKKQEVEKRYQRALEEAKKNREYHLERLEKELEKSKKSIEVLDKLKYDELAKQVETEQDKKFKILFGEVEL